MRRNQKLYCSLRTLFIGIFIITGYCSSISAQTNYIDMDGTDDEIQCGPGPDLSGSFTIETWARRTGTGQEHHIMSMGSAGGNNGLHIRFQNDNSLKFGFWINDFVVPGGPWAVDAQWHHYAFTYNTSTNTRSIYVDGVFIGSDVSPADFAGTGDLVIGDIVNGFAFNRPFLGQLDEMRIWNVERTQTEIQSNMNYEISPNQPGLLAYFNFNQGVCGGDNTALPAPQVTDITGNGYDGTMTNMAQNLCVSNFVCSGSCPIPQNGVFGPPPIPTMGEWGIIILILLLLNIGTVTLRKTNLVLAGTSTESQISFRQFPFDKRLYFKILAPVVLAVLGVFTISSLMFGYVLTSSDIPGSLLAIPLLAYLIHLILIKE